MFRFYPTFLRDVLKCGFLGTGQLGVTLSATPTLRAVALTAAYTYSTAHEVEADLSGTTTIVAEWDGEDSSEVRFDDGILWVADGGPATLVADGTDATQLALLVDHGSWTRLIGLYDDFDGAPFSVDTGDTPVIEWSRMAMALFDFFACSTATAGLYPRFIEEVLGALIGGTARTDLPSTATIKLELLRYAAAYRWAHRYYGHVPAAWLARTDGAAAPSLASKTVTVSGSDAYLDADDTTFTTPAGEDAHSLLLYVNDSPQHLAAFGPIGNGGSSHHFLPLNGANRVLQWAAADPFLLRLRA